MSKYTGTQTERNLEAAFAGESQARNKYTYFASTAKKEGFEQIAAIFLKTAENEKSPLTYADYQNRIKPKNSQKKEGGKIKGWKCRICGHVFEGAELPLDFSCPLCGHPREDFDPIYE